MSVTAAQWCICCGAAPECVITVERNGVLAHYGSCFAHLHPVATRMLSDLRAVGPLPRKADDVIDVGERKAIT